MNEIVSIKPEMSTDELQVLGRGHIGYVRTIDAARASELAGRPFVVPQGTMLYALFAADGSPILISDTRQAAVAGAAEHELMAVSVH